MRVPGERSSHLFETEVSRHIKSFELLHIVHHHHQLLSGFSNAHVITLRIVEDDKMRAKLYTASCEHEGFLFALSKRSTIVVSQPVIACSGSRTSHRSGPRSVFTCCMLMSLAGLPGCGWTWTSPLVSLANKMTRTSVSRDTTASRPFAVSAAVMADNAMTRSASHAACFTSTPLNNRALVSSPMRAVLFWALLRNAYCDVVVWASSIRLISADDFTAARLSCSCDLVVCLSPYDPHLIVVADDVIHVEVDDSLICERGWPNHHME